MYLQVKKNLDLPTLMLKTMQTETHLFFVGLGERPFNLKGGGGGGGVCFFF